MSLNKSIRYLLAILFVCSAMTAEVLAKNHCAGDKPKKKHSKKDPLKGTTWTAVISPVNTAPEVLDWGNFAFHSDGIVTGGDTGALGEGSLGSPVLGTAFTGLWKRVSKRCYKIEFITTIVNLSDNPPYTPIGWFSVQADGTLSKDKQTLTLSNAIAKFYNLTDPTLSEPTELAIGSATLYRITFANFSE